MDYFTYMKGEQWLHIQGEIGKYSLQGIEAFGVIVYILWKKIKTSTVNTMKLLYIEKSMFLPCSFCSL